MRGVSDTFTQGGQTQLHKIRMISQVLSSTLKVSLGISLIAFIGLLIYDRGWEQIIYLATYYKAMFRESMKFLPYGFLDSSWVLHRDGNYYEIHDHILVNRPEYLAAVTASQIMLFKTLMQTFMVFLISMIILFAYWIHRGRTLKIKDVISGSTDVPLKDLIRLIRKDKKASDLQLSGLPLIKDSETKHMLIVGTTGAGKTNAFSHLLPQVRKKGQKAIIVDTTGTFVEKFYNPDTDVLLNPLDLRSASWSLWKECQTDIQIDDFASSMIPQTLHDQFWCDGSRLLFSETIKILRRQNKCSVAELLDYAIHRPLKAIQGFYYGTSAAALIDQSADKTAASIRLTLATHLKSLHLIQDKEADFSIREWVKDDSQTGWLFITSLPEQRETLRPLMSSWLNIAINGLMSCAPDTTRRLWFFIDEKQSLNKIEALPKALAEIRKYGGCIVAGLQNISQLDKLYGHECRKTMSSLYNTKIFFRSPDTDTAQWISKMIGEQEILENSESISFGAHQMRDGVSINEQKKQKPVIPYSTFLNLKDMEAYIKLPEHYPVTKLAFTYKNLETLSPAFVENQELLNSMAIAPIPAEDNQVEEENVILETEQPEPPFESSEQINLLRIDSDVENHTVGQCKKS